MARAEADGTFDGVFSWYSTIHDPEEDMDCIIAEIVRVLRPGGLLWLAFQTGQAMRRMSRGFKAMGYDIVMNRYHRAVDEVASTL